MEWVQFIIFFIGVFGLFIWNRSESRSDMRHMDSKLEAQRNLIIAIHEDGQKFQQVMIEESKDFHKRLCEIEAKSKLKGG